VAVASTNSGLGDRSPMISEMGGFSFLARKVEAIVYASTRIPRQQREAENMGWGSPSSRGGYTPLDTGRQESLGGEAVTGKMLSVIYSNVQFLRATAYML